MTDRRRFDVAVIGAGIAGASVAAELSEHCGVVLFEMESQPGFHTTGRSAAVFAPTYGPGAVRALTRASEPFFRSPPDGFAEEPLLSPRGLVFVARDDQLEQMQGVLDELGSDSSLELVDPEQMCVQQPLLRKDYAAAGIYDRNCSDIDVNSLHQGYLRRFASLGGTVLTSSEVCGFARQNDVWSLKCRNESYEASIVVNAAGAWADVVGKMAGAETINLVPKRRTALIIDPQSDQFTQDAPLMVDIAEEFYVKPDAGRLLISPANEDSDVPSDVQPDEMDIALCIHRVEQAFDVKIRRIESKWAGLRSFVSDKVPVAGFSEQVDGFYWLAAQGGYGIQTAPALAHFAAAQVIGQSIPDYIREEGVTSETLSPARLANSS